MFSRGAISGLEGSVVRVSDGSKTVTNRELSMLVVALLSFGILERDVDDLEDGMEKESFMVAVGEKEEEGDAGGR